MKNGGNGWKKVVKGGKRRMALLDDAQKFLRNQKRKDFFENAMVVALVYRGFMRE